MEHPANSDAPAFPSADAGSVSRPALLAIILFAIVCGLPSLALPIGRDQGIGLYIADVLRTGGAPYKDAWEIRPPGIFYLYAAAIQIFGKSTFAFRFWDLLWQTATVVALSLLGTRLFGRREGLPAGPLYAFVYFLGNDYWNLGNTDAYVALPSVCALLLVTSPAESRRFARDLAAGLLMGMVFLVRFTHGLLYLPVLLALLNEARARGSGAFRRALMRTSVVSAGFALAIGAFLLHMTLAGGVSDFFYTLFVFAPRYAVLTHHGSAADFVRFAVPILTAFADKYAILCLPALAAVFGIAARKRTTKDWIGPVWLAATLGGIAVMAKFYAYHWLPLFAPLALLASRFWGFVVEAWLGRARRAAVIATLIGLVATGAFVRSFASDYARQLSDAASYWSGRITWLARVDRFERQHPSGDFSLSSSYRAAEYLREHTRPDDPVFIWGFETLVYYLADRRPPTRFCSNYPIIAQWHRQDWYEELFDALRNAPPVYIVLVQGDAMPWITGHGYDSVQSLARLFPDLRSFILDHYRVETTIGTFTVCRRAEAAPSEQPPPPT